MPKSPSDFTKREKPKYTGILAEPIILSTYSATMANALLNYGKSADELAKQKEAALFKATAERLEALERHYNIPPSHKYKEMALLLHLARDWVPGFKVLDYRPNEPGRPSEWSFHQKLELVSDVVSLCDTRHTVSRACEFLVDPKKGKYRKRYAKRKMTARAMARRYYLARKEIVTDKMFAAKIAEASGEDAFLTLLATRWSVDGEIEWEKAREARAAERLLVDAQKLSE